MRGINKRGLEDLKMMGSYMALRKVKPDFILSSCALRAQQTAESLAMRIDYTGDIQYMDELYLTKMEMALNVLSTQEDSYDSIFFIGHNPVLTELAKLWVKDYFFKFPSLGILALNFNIDSWNELLQMEKAEMDFFIFPKQFKYYMPKQIQDTLS